MAKIDEINMYLSTNCMNTDKEKSMRDIMKIFKVGESSAKKYYYGWKKISISKNSIPSEERKHERQELVDKRLPKKTGKFNYDEIMKNAKKDYKLKIKKAIIEGEYGNYQLNEDGSVQIGEVVFRNNKDVEEYKRREIEIFMSKLGEILDVMEMEIR